MATSNFLVSTFLVSVGFLVLTVGFLVSRFELSHFGFLVLTVGCLVSRSKRSGFEFSRGGDSVTVLFNSYWRNKVYSSEIFVSE